MGNLKAREIRVSVQQLPVEISQETLAAFEEHPTASIRVVAAALGSAKLHIYHYNSVTPFSLHTISR